MALFFFFNDPATTEIYTLSLHDALPICLPRRGMSAARPDSLPGTIPASWLVPEWPAPPGVHALCTSREGGVSTAPWGSLNLGDHVGDDPQADRKSTRLNSSHAKRSNACF